MLSGIQSQTVSPSEVDNTEEDFNRTGPMQSPIKVERLPLVKQKYTSNT